MVVTGTLPRPEAAVPSSADCLRAARALLCEAPRSTGRAPRRVTFQAVQHGGQVRYLFPAAAPAAQRAAVTSYPRLRTHRRRVTRWSMGQVLTRPGLARLVARPLSWDVAPASVLGVLQQTFGAGLQVSARLPGRGRARPYLLTLLDGDGRIQGFAKVSAAPAVSRGLAREAEALTLAEQLPQCFVAPRLLLATTVGAARMIVVAPLPASAQRPPRGKRGAPSWELIRAVSNLGSASTATTTAEEYLDRLEERLAGGATRAAFRRWRKQTADAPDLPVGRWHGDLSPWNMAVDGDLVWLWDWERSTMPVPVGFDLIHHYYQVARLTLRLGPAGALRFRAASHPVLRTAGLAGSIPILMRLHQWELTAQQSERGVDRPGGFTQEPPCS